MLTTFEQVREWITDNGFKRWILYKDFTKTDRIIDSAAFAVSDMADKIAMTEKYLRLAGGRAFAAGGASSAASEMNVTAEIRLQDETPQAQGTQGVGVAMDAQYIGQLRDEITRSVRAEIERDNYKKEREKFEEDKKEFEAEKQSAIGALIHYFAPIGQTLIQKHIMPRVAGVDAEEPVHVAPIVAERPQEREQEPQEPQEESPFTDEEADELFALMARFKKAEPEYLTMIRKVVEMAESGDATYNMAKGFLCK